MADHVDDEELCDHRRAWLQEYREPTYWAPLRNPLPFLRLPCPECATEDHAAWVTSVKTRLDRGLTRLSQGLDSGWDAPQWPTPPAAPRPARPTAAA